MSSPNELDGEATANELADTSASTAAAEDTPNTSALPTDITIDSIRDYTNQQPYVLYIKWVTVALCMFTVAVLLA